MSDVTPGRFSEFFLALHEHGPYSWQERLLERAVEGDWPPAIDLPTGSGKTACIDIAIFALSVSGREIQFPGNREPRLRRLGF